MGGFGTAIEVWGDYALFTRPELSVERVSYDVITPSACRGIVEAIYWHPGIRYVIDRIHVLNPITFTNVKRNEVKSKALASALRAAAGGTADLPYINRRTDIQQRGSLVLTNVRYIIETHFVMTEKAAPEDNPGKFCDMLRRRLRKGQCFSTPYLGTREFSCGFKIYEGALPPPDGAYAGTGERDLGIMLYDMDYGDPQNIVPTFYRAVMYNGTIDVAGSEVYR